MKAVLRALLAAAIFCAVFAVHSPSADAAPPLAKPAVSEIGDMLQLVQACAPGWNFDFRLGRCVSANDFRGSQPPVRRGGYGACPNGYNFDGRGCVPASRENFGVRACPPGTNPDGRGGCAWSGGVACPPGFNAIQGRCFPSR
jgi:hypothetical protein